MGYLAAFVAGLALSLLVGFHLLWPLVWGWLLFALACLRAGRTVPWVLKSSWDSMRKMRRTLFVLVGVSMLAATWRQSGTMAYIIYTAVPLIDPTLFWPGIVIFCAVMAKIIGSTMGTIGMVGLLLTGIASAMGLNVVITAGAVISGCVMGSRLSPFAPVQCLITDLCGTPTRDIMSALWRTGSLSMLGCILGFWWLAGTPHDAGATAGSVSVLAEAYALSPWLALPVVVQVALPLLRVGLLEALLTSSCCAGILAAWLQHVPVKDVVEAILFGYTAPPGVAMLAGGGLPTMLATLAIVCVTAPFGVLLQGSGILPRLRASVRSLAEHIGLRRAMLVVCAILSPLACNILLTLMLACDMADSLQPDKRRLAVDLANTAYAVTYFVPWSVSCLVPFAIMGVGVESMAYFLFPMGLFLETLFRRDTRVVIQE